ncbi:transcription factor SOX-30-like [Anthonomus grandis grandis]|uniref:transcription factor SOX-30-like n=1 Tax=Anthonomus grandis grandis TaxID=2921223 RepID=UPI0021664116|nr:transcription factor SOX-30-like [Anthonomus grandis grandis]
MNCCMSGAAGSPVIPQNTNQQNNRIVCPIYIHQKIPRPPNAFMLYANEHRKALAHMYPADSNKEISRRLGQTWKDLSVQEKNDYFQRAKDVDLEHKRKYPGYVYNPKDARLRKAIKSTIKDRSIGASPMLPRPYVRNGPIDFYQNILMTNPLAQVDKPTLSWTGLMDLPGQSSENSYFSGQFPTGDKPSTVTKTVYETSNSSSLGLPLNLVENSQEVDKEKSSLEVEEEPGCNYMPISGTKFIQDPDLFTNNEEYHKEYIMKYFSQIPDYETYNVTTEDGITFPYVTLSTSVHLNPARGSYNIN